jgi:predicted DNA-binding protein (MmcQ/YjbR family)
MALPNVQEVEAWSEPTFRIKSRMFAMYANANNHHGEGRHSVWIKALAEERDVLVAKAGKQYFVPAYMGQSGWIGAYLDEVADWVEIEALMAEGYRLAATKRLK